MLCVDKCSPMNTGLQKAEACPSKALTTRSRLLRLWWWNWWGVYLLNYPMVNSTPAYWGYVCEDQLSTHTHTHTHTRTHTHAQTCPVALHPSIHPSIIFCLFMLCCSGSRLSNVFQMYSLARLTKHTIQSKETRETLEVTLGNSRGIIHNKLTNTRGKTKIHINYSQ